MGRGIRLFVGGFLGLFLIAGLVGVEAWPLTGWKLYARLRHSDFWGWQVLAVERDGSVASLDIRNLPAAYHGVNHLLNDFDALSHDERQAACVGLIEAARLQYPDVTGVAIDHIRGHVPVHPADPPRPPSRRIRIHQCRAE
ncbi:MAG: hypothetical protein LC792_03275 [Actinobacteria bacterium]|nr:hypothetical protein [Actinomycetota bacterium]